MAQKFINVGNSVGLVVPQLIRNEVGIASGDSFDIFYTKKQIVITPLKKNKKTKSKVTEKFAKMVDEFMEDHKDVLEELSRR